MALSDLERRILTKLRLEGGIVQGQPRFDDATSDEVMKAIDRLQRLQCVSVYGPPNQNSQIGMDVDELSLLPNARGYLANAY